MTEQKNYVELFLFSPDERRVVLQQAPQGNWTGVFGELKPGETPADAANRVFIENTNVAHRYWRPEAALQISNDGMHVTIFTAVSPNLDLVRTSNKCIVQVHEPEAAINNGMLHNTTRWVLLMCLDNLRHSHTAQIIYDGIYGQLTGIHAHVPDPAKGLKIGIVCNEYTDFNAFVVKARRLSVNDDNRFFCILSAKELYGHKFDFYYLLDPMDKLNHGALTAINSMNFQGMISDDALIEKYIKPAL